MPADYNSEAVWNEVYDKTRPRVEPWISDYEWLQPDGSWGPEETKAGPMYTRRSKDIVGYGRAWALNFGGFNNDLDYHNGVRDKILAACPTMGASDRILCAGTGCGFLVESFLNAGYTEAYGLEPSEYIHNQKAGDVDPRVVLVKESIGGNQLKNRLRQGTGDDIFAWVIDEEILLGYNDTEIVANIGAGLTIVTAMEEILDPAVDTSHVVHLVRQGVSNSPNVYRRPLSQWQSYAPSHTWIDVEAN